MNVQTLLVENEKLKCELAESSAKEKIYKEILAAEKNASMARIAELEQTVAELSEQVALLKILHFGPKSEKWTAEDEKQARLFNEAEDGAFAQSDEEAQKSVIDEQEIKGHKRRKRYRNQGRKPLPKDLPREEVVHDLDEEEKTCSCGTEKTLIGEDTSERVKLIPAKLVILVEKRKKYACKGCEGTHGDEPGITTAKGVRHLLPGSIADESFLAWCVSEKYEFALPLYRQAKRMKYIGLDISRSSLSRQMVRTGYACEGLYDCMGEHILSGDHINADETRLQVLKEPGRKATDRSWMWVFLGGPPDKRVVRFQYDERRNATVPQTFLRGFTGFLQTDDYASYHTAVRELNNSKRASITHALCWQHARSTFHKAWEVIKSEHAHTAISYIQKLFALEDLRKDFSVKGFLKQRKNRADLILEEFLPWLQDLYKKTPPKGLLGKAIHYTLDNWEGLKRYLDHPALTPSNNLAENAIRPFVIGRKNFLFSATPKGAKASAILYSLVESAKLNKLNVYNYLYYIFRNISSAQSKDDLQKLLPFNLTPEDIQLPS